jgi:ABC-2 type transport system permease protein
MRQVKTFILLVCEEFRLSLAFRRRYFFSTIITFVSNLIVMGGLILVSIPSVSYGSDIQAVLQDSNANRLLGFLYFFLGMSSLGLPEGVVSDSRQLGTIDRIALSPLGLAGVIGAKFLPSYVSCLVDILISIILLSLIFGLRVMWSFGPIILNSVIAALGMLGLGYILGGLTIRFKQLGLVKNLLFVLLFALGIMPMGYDGAEGLSWFAKFFPFTQGLLRTRHAVLPGSAGTTSVPLWLFVGCSTVLLFLGILVFSRFERQSIKRGTLGSY